MFGINIEIILMVGAFLCGAVGTLIAKQARKKSSYPLLYLSGALAVLTAIGLVGAIIFIFFMK